MEVFGIDDYVDLTPEERDSFDQWLRDCGAIPERTRSVRIEGDKIITVEWAVNRRGKPKYNRKMHDVETIETIHEKVGEPPCWKRPSIH